MGIDSRSEAYKASNLVDIGIVMFGESLRLHYANDQARDYMERAENREAVLPSSQDLRLEIIKLGTQIRDRSSVGSCPHPDRREARKTVRTKQGAFHLRALPVPDPSPQSGPKIMILIEDRVRRCPTVSFPAGEPPIRAK